MSVSFAMPAVVVAGISVVVLADIAGTVDIAQCWTADVERKAVPADSPGVEGWLGCWTPRLSCKIFTLSFHRS